MLVFVSCFHNPHNSDMDYRLFNVCAWSFSCVHIHTGVGHTESEAAQHFWLGITLTICVCAPDGVRTSSLLILSPMHYQLSHRPPLFQIQQFYVTLKCVQVNWKWYERAKLNTNIMPNLTLMTLTVSKQIPTLTIWTRTTGRTDDLTLIITDWQLNNNDNNNI